GVGVLHLCRGQLGSACLAPVFPMLSIVLAATCAAFATVAVKRWGHDTEPISFNAASMAVGAGALAGVSLIAREPWAVPTWPQGLGAILYLAIVGSVVTFVAWQWLLKGMQATFLSYLALVIPIVAVLLGASLGNETLDVIGLAGAGIVLLGIYVSTSRRAAAFARAAMGQGIAEPDPVDPPPRKTLAASLRRGLWPAEAGLLAERPELIVRHPAPPLGSVAQRNDERPPVSLHSRPA